MSDLEQLEHNADIALERLDVAEDLGWVVAILFAVIAHDYSDSFIASFVVFVLGYIAVTYRYRKDEKRHEEAFRAADSEEN